MRICAVVLTVVALTAACTTACTTGAPAPQPSPTTTSSPAPPSLAELDQRARTALAPPGAFDALQGHVEKSFPANDGDPGAEREVVTALCGRELLVDSGTSVARSRVWEGGVRVFERVHAMSDLPAAVLMRTVRAGSRNCVLYSPAGTVFADEPVANPQGVDESYAHCEMHDEPGVTPWACHAVLARGTLIATVVSFGNTREAASAQLSATVPIFAESLAKA
jgi:hypothetical protein